MNFIKQITAEMKNMIHSKFIIISASIIFLLITIVPTLFATVINNTFGGPFYGGVYYESYGMNIDWEIENLEMSLEYAGQDLSAEQLKYLTAYVDELLAFYEKYQDAFEEESYITNMIYEPAARVGENFILDLEPGYDPEELKMGLSYVYYNDEFINSLPEKTDAELQAMYDENLNIINLYDELVTSREVGKYVEIQKIFINERIENYVEQIEVLEASIIENPENEEVFSSQIDDMNANIRQMQEIQIPTLDYRAENNIAPNDGSWQDGALNAAESARYNIEYSQNPMSEDAFNNDPWMVQQYQTYDDYLKENEIIIQNAQLDLKIAQDSIDSGKPDMSFVEDGARVKTQSTLSATMFIAVFGILVGGWAVASEFQSGTIRLLMIRPRTREKVFISRFIAGLVLTFLLFLSVFVFNTLLNGFIYGFGDYAFPNYTGSGEINFFVMLIGQFFATSTALIFFYVLSFFASSIFKNMAVAIILPTLCLVGGAIFMAFLTQLPLVQFLSFTPIPYISMENFFLESSGYVIDNLITKGMMLSVSLGAAVMLVYSAILFVISMITFKKLDITN